MVRKLFSSNTRCCAGHGCDSMGTGIYGMNACLSVCGDGNRQKCTEFKSTMQHFFSSGYKLSLMEQAWQTSLLASWRSDFTPLDKSMHRWKQVPQGQAADRYGITSPGFPWCQGKRYLLWASTKEKLPGAAQGWLQELAPFRRRGSSMWKWLPLLQHPAFSSSRRSGLARTREHYYLLHRLLSMERSPFPSIGGW